MTLSAFFKSAVFAALRIWLDLTPMRYLEKIQTRLLNLNKYTDDGHVVRKSILILNFNISLFLSLIYG